jgi:predicted dehydrogenase
MIDFNFPELRSWQRAKALLEDGAIGHLRNIVVTWNFENRATRLRMEPRSAIFVGAPGFDPGTPSPPDWCA